MDVFNLEWLEENYINKKPVIYHIGCANLSSDSFRMQVCLPSATIFSFDCAKFWKEENLTFSSNFDMHYSHCAVSNKVCKKKFYYRDIEFGETYRWCSTLSNNPRSPELGFNPEINFEIIDCITVNEFCKTNPSPNFIYVCAEQEEYNILSSINEQHLPDIIWLENNDYYNDDESNSKIPYETLKFTLENKNYRIEFKNKNHSLYVKNNYKITMYKDIPYNSNQWSAHEKKLQERMWIKRYNLVKGSSWPTITSINEFKNLEIWIQKECCDLGVSPDERFFI